ncbi:O-methyltransferase [Paraburkholderia humisilvae]|uniref:Catechol O-methyltransferase n=1 Tax=Paraburkholderia humisilvae TaxID=627669 RepID=A0A6J5E6J3_9BURK|nr:O-methyltransferase [Paraburkholderia humisilvae]CAB3762118.1 Catechol O-methyltransferase [Paraburkholderia humisilvae]
MTEWSAVDEYIESRLVPPDPVLDHALAANAAAGLPAYDVAPNQGKLLYLFARMIGARRVLEIGTLGGYSTIWLARALPEGGKVVTLEANAVHARVAQSNIDHAGLTHAVDLRIGPALESLPALTAQAPFDLIFIDADKPNNPSYLEWALKLSRPGTVIIGDNVVRAGEVVNAASADPNVQGVRRFFDMIAHEPRLTATALQTVGVKGWDGFAIAVVDA